MSDTAVTIDALALRKGGGPRIAAMTASRTGAPS